METKFKGTQGVWEVNPRALRNVRCHNLTVANCSSGQSGDREEEEIENAKLIAAAPELLKAIEGFISDFEGDYVMDDGRIVDNPDNILVTNYEIMKKVLEKAL